MVYYFGLSGLDDMVGVRVVLGFLSGILGVLLGVQRPLRFCCGMGVLSSEVESLSSPHHHDPRTTSAFSSVGSSDFWHPQSSNLQDGSYPSPAFVTLPERPSSHYHYPA